MRQGGHNHSALSMGVRGIVVLVCCMLPAMSACADREPWPQYANIAPLPGAGLAINAKGERDGLGALQVNIPLAYTPSPDYLSISAYAGNYSNENDEDFGNFSGVFAATVGFRPRVFLSAMQVSRHLEEAKALSAQLPLCEETARRPGVAVGIQDMQEKERESRSVYAVATKQLSRSGTPIYGTIGYGGGRFLDGFFGGASMPLGDRFNVAAEWDGFQINTGVAWRPGGRRGGITLLAGYNGRAGLLAGLTTTVSIGPGRGIR